MLSAGKMAQVALAVAMPTTMILLYWWYSRSSNDEEVYGRRTVVTTKQTRIEMFVPKKAVGAIIGKQGVVIKQIQKESGARVKFFDRDEDKEESGEPNGQRTLVIFGTAEAAQQAELMIHQIIADIPEILTEEIEVPHYAIGRLIGKGGKTIREMCLSSGAKMEISRLEDFKGPEEPRVVRLMGSRSQIDAILDLISERLQDEENFRNKLSASAANRETRSGQGRQAKEPIAVRPVAVPVEKDLWDSLGDTAAPKQDKLPTKSSGYFEVYVSAVESPGHLWVQTVGTKALQLEELQIQITAFAGTEEAKQNYRVTDVVEGQMVAARFEEEDSVYYRAKVLGEMPDGKIDLYFVDFGDNTYADRRDIFRLRSDFTSFPHQAIECQLANVEPAGGVWSEEAITYFEDSTYCAQWKVIYCRTVGHSSHIHSGELTPLVQLFDTSGAKDIDIGAALVEKGFAVAVDSTNQKAKPTGVSNDGSSHGSQAPPMPELSNGAASDGNQSQGPSNHMIDLGHGGSGS
ncbi:hypothetical protein RRG08_008178 [Elysia crispata]|uniref:Tudor and KH domain-containing protein n=1 Tax=Elysia crispata TaxID=231223 RepID=A0AAE1A756_9GAST|nr:hypothetical protein RRG08_008178 [Elysia crispata]